MHDAGRPFRFSYRRVQPIGVSGSFRLHLTFARGNSETTMADKVFQGTVVLPDRIIENGYVLVGDGAVQSVGSGAAPEGEKHGGADFFVLPGAIDAQVHSRSQLGQEDFIWSTRSAAAGGVTTIVDMPYDDNCLIATAERFRTKVRRGRRAGARRFRALCHDRSGGRRRAGR